MSGADDPGYRVAARERSVGDARGGRSLERDNLPPHESPAVTSSCPAGFARPDLSRQSVCDWLAVQASAPRATTRAVP